MGNKKTPMVAGASCRPCLCPDHSSVLCHVVFGKQRQYGKESSHGECPPSLKTTKNRDKQPPEAPLSKSEWGSHFTELGFLQMLVQPLLCCVLGGKKCPCWGADLVPRGPAGSAAPQSCPFSTTVSAQSKWEGEVAGSRGTEVTRVDWAQSLCSGERGRVVNFQFQPPSFSCQKPTPQC